jgi:aspartate racemase
MAELTSGRGCGLVGGLGPAATSLVYQSLLRAHAERGLKPDIAIVHADVARILAAAARRDLDGLAAYLAGLIARLKAAGADFAAIPAVTPHICMPTLRRISPLPIVSIVEAMKEGLRARGSRRIALFGTRFSIESAVFGELSEFDVIAPRPDEIDVIHGIYVALVTDGRGSAAQAEILRGMAHRLIARESLDAIVLAGTELALLMDEDSAGFPAVDCARLHVEAIVRAAASPADKAGEPSAGMTLQPVDDHPSSP